jgi:hypothetical protein
MPVNPQANAVNATSTRAISLTVLSPERGHSGQAGEDLIRRVDRDERLRVLVIGTQVAADGLFGFAGAAMSARLIRRVLSRRAKKRSTRLSQKAKVDTKYK